MSTCDSEPSRTSRWLATIFVSVAMLAFSIGLPAVASAEDYSCQGSTEPNHHCYAVVGSSPSADDGSFVHIFTNNDYVPPLCNGDTTLCDFVSNESWVVFKEPTHSWAEAGDFTGGDFGYSTETPTDFAGNEPYNNSGFGFFIYPDGGPGQDSSNEVQILYNGGGNYSINFDQRNVFNFGNDAAPLYLETGMEETDTRIKSEGASYYLYYYKTGAQTWWPSGSRESINPNNKSVICGHKFESEGRTTQQNFVTTSTFGGSSC